MNRWRLRIPEPTAEETDNLGRSTKKVKTNSKTLLQGWIERWSDEESLDRWRKKSYEDSVLNTQPEVIMGDIELNEEDNLSDDDGIGEEEDGPWLVMGIARERRWKLGLNGSTA